MKVRPTESHDIAALQLVLEGTELFPSVMLPDMINGFLSGQAPDEIWLTCEWNGTSIGFCYAVQEELTEGTYNMLAIAVLPSVQSKGAGSAIISALEEMLRDQGHRILIADTSGADEFAKTRAFYEMKGYTQEARIRDFWSAGNDKIVYWKAL
jgi:GNAT superfamily N-acetyltransferase